MTEPVRSFVEEKKTNLKWEYITIKGLQRKSDGLIVAKKQSNFCGAKESYLK